MRGSMCRVLLLLVSDARLDDRLLDLAHPAHDLHGPFHGRNNDREECWNCQFVASTIVNLLIPREAGACRFPGGV